MSSIRKHSSPAIQVMIIDDSALVRQFMSEVIGQQPDMQILATAADPEIAMMRMNKQWPDVIVLDIDLPKMDGLSFLRQIMQQRPTPVVICSSLTETGAQKTVEAFRAGAVAVFAKAKLGVRQHLQSITRDLIQAIREASQSHLSSKSRAKTTLTTSSSSSNTLPRHPVGSGVGDKLIAIGTSTGGTTALEQILTKLTPDIPGIVIVQHMPEKFTEAFAQRLDSLSQIRVVEAVTNQLVEAGTAYIAPGGRHTRVIRNGKQYYMDVFDAPPVNRHRPSVDVLFHSVAEQAGSSALGLILTGMGDDGARGLLAMRRAGAYTVAQNEASCIVFGMPKEAIKLGAAEQILALDFMPNLIQNYQKVPQ